jgi:hypothetical protein
MSTSTMQPKIMYPMFYIKHVGGKFSVEHRLTHTYITTVSSEKDLKKIIKHYIEMPPELFWQEMMDKRAVRIPEKKRGFFSTHVDDNSDYEKWFKEAWSQYTDKFYKKYPSLLVEQTELPYDIINGIKRERYAKDREEEMNRRKEIEEAEEQFKEDERQRKLEEKKKQEEEKVGRIGSETSLKKMKKEKRRGAKKLKIKGKAGKNINIMDSDDPFA